MPCCRIACAASWNDGIRPTDLGFGQHTERACHVQPKILGDAAAQSLVDDHPVRGVLPRQNDGLLLSAIEFEEDGQSRCRFIYYGDDSIQ